MKYVHGSIHTHISITLINFPVWQQQAFVDGWSTSRCCVLVREGQMPKSVLEKLVKFLIVGRFFGVMVYINTKSVLA